MDAPAAPQPAASFEDSGHDLQDEWDDDPSIMYDKDTEYPSDNDEVTRGGGR
jgi:hypothetical protein